MLVIGPRLIAIDADLNAGELRSRYPDCSEVMVVPGVISILLPRYYPGNKPNSAKQRVQGNVNQIPASIHVPRPFSEAFERHKDKRTSYIVHVSYGRLLEPWVTGVEFIK